MDVGNETNYARAFATEVLSFLRNRLNFTTVKLALKCLRHGTKEVAKEDDLKRVLQAVYL